MPDAIMLLTEDHRRVDDLLDRISADAQPDPETVNRIIKELSIHDAVEREYLYPTLRDRAAGGNDLSDHSVDEHIHLAALLAEIDRRDEDDPHRRELLSEVATAVRTHVDEEERVVFPALRAGMTAGELERLGTTIEEAKAKAPTRPHPKGPGSGVGTKVVGAFAAPLDKARDALGGRS